MNRPPTAIVWIIHIFFMATPFIYLSLYPQIQEMAPDSPPVDPNMQYVIGGAGLVSVLIGLFMPVLLKRFGGGVNNPFVNTIVSDACFESAAIIGLILPFVGGLETLTYTMIGGAFVLLLGNSFRVYQWLAESKSR